MNHHNKSCIVDQNYLLNSSNNNFCKNMGLNNYNRYSATKKKEKENQKISSCRNFSG